MGAHLLMAFKQIDTIQCFVGALYAFFIRRKEQDLCSKFVCSGDVLNYSDDQVIKARKYAMQYR